MRYSSRASVEYDLELHYRLRKKYTEECNSRSAFEGWSIKKNRENKGRSYYVIKQPGDKQYRYAGSGSDSDIEGVRENAFYRKMLSVIDTNISCMESFLRIYQDTHAEHINELLRPAYKLSRSAALSISEPAVSKWLEEGLELKNRFPVFDPDGLKVRAFDGTKMRSRAEAIHYEAFFIFNIPAIFELPYLIDQETYRPDFTALDVFTMQPKMIEHLGNWFHQNEYKRNRYRDDSVHRWDEYAKIGFFPESNLMLTFGADDSTFDVQAIFRKISMLATPPPSLDTIEMLKRS